MASIRKITGKTGVSYKITVSMGRDSQGKQRRRFTTWTPDPGMTARQAEKAVQKFAIEFETQLMQGHRPDDKITFEKYSQYYLETKRMGGMRLTTLSMHRDMLRRIMPAIGHIQMKDIRPSHLNALWKNLSEPGMKITAYKAHVTETFKDAAKGYTAVEIAAAAGLAASTVRNALHGGSISRDTADKLAAVMGLTARAAYTQEGRYAALAPITVKTYASLVSSVFSLAVREGLVQVNPVSRSTLPKVPAKEALFLEPTGIADVLDALETEPFQWQVFVHFLLASGCRRGEACALKWSRVDFDEGTVTIDLSLVPTSSDGLVLGPTKTGKSRTISMPSQTMALLKRLRAQQRELRFAAGSEWIDEDFVFTGATGKPMHPSNVSTWIARFAKRHSLPPLHTHEFRHTAASLLIEQGVDIAAVASRLGHARKTTLLNIYTHAIERADKTASNALENVIYSKHAAK